MDAQQFLAEFGHIANAPRGVARLRELVRTLAIQGKLTARNPKDGHASDLLKEVLAEKERLTSLGQMKRERPWSRVSEQETRYSIPSTWTWVRFGEITVNRDGERVPVSSLNRDKVDKVYDYYGASGVIDKFDRYLFDKTLLLVGEDGANLINRTTPIAFLAHGKYWVNNHAHVLDATHGNILRYLALFLNSVSLVPYVTGTAQPKLNQAKLSNIAVAMPPLPEQARIVAKVDELMALCDQLEQQQQDRHKLQNALRQSTLQALASAESPHELQKSWQRLQANFGRLFREPRDVRDLRSALVELAIRGALSPLTDIHSAVNAAQLLDRLASLRLGKRSEQAAHIKPPFDLPSTWRWARFDELLDGSESGWSPKCDAEPRRPGEWGVLKVSAVTWGEFRPEENKRLPPSLDARPECEVKAGDFLLSRANTADLVARSVIVADGVPDRLMMSDKIVRLKFTDPELKSWANLVNNSIFAREHYRANATGTSDSMRNVSRQVIHDLPIPLPPKHVQEAVMRKLTDFNRLCDSLEEQLKQAALHAERLAAISVAAVSGITIEQDEVTAVKAPQTELIAPLRLGTLPDVKDQAPLATLLARHQGEMSARDLWQRFGGEIDAFYAQLKTEVAHGWITEPPVAEVRAKPAEAAGA